MVASVAVGRCAACIRARALTANRPQTSAAPAALLAKFAITAAPFLRQPQGNLPGRPAVCPSQPLGFGIQVNYTAEYS